MTTQKIIQQVIQKINNCTLCELYHNGRAKPFVGKKYKYIIIAEAPGKDEVERNTPLCGKTGKLLFDFLSKNNVERDDFIILNACNCRPIIEKNGLIKNGKPTENNLKKCYRQNIALIYYSGCNKIITLGDYAKYLFVKKLGGISKYVGKNKKVQIKDRLLSVTFNYHPSYAFIYNKKARLEFEQIFLNFINS